VQVGFSDYGG